MGDRPRRSHVDRRRARHERRRRCGVLHRCRRDGDVDRTPSTATSAVRPTGTSVWRLARMTRRSSREGPLSMSTSTPSSVAWWSTAPPRCSSSGFRLESGSTTVLAGPDDGGGLFVQPGGELVLRNDALVEGSIVVADFGESGRGVLTLDGDVAVSGTGSLPVEGTLRKTGPGNCNGRRGPAPHRPDHDRVGRAKEHSSSPAPTCATAVDETQLTVSSVQ